MITIGVTGGVGSGKSEILSYLEKEYNCRILMSDNAAKELEKPGGVLYGPLIELLERYAEGTDCGPILEENGEIVKTEMARRIFLNLRSISIYWMRSTGREKRESGSFSFWNPLFWSRTDMTALWIPCGISTAVKRSGIRGSKQAGDTLTKRSARSSVIRYPMHSSEPHATLSLTTQVS